ncbi:MAG: prolipoprotein diacylglyceryl transferase [Bacteroidales bacterium]|nr:prolipoprotein diacylglyceryl transferase [Bacteroidales bacterium]
MDLLSIVWNADPEIFRIGGFALRYYSVLFLSGFILGYYIFRWFYKREQLPLEQLDTLFFVSLISALIGARLGHVIGYDLRYYLAHPWEILMTWKGGLASHGGAVGLLIGLWWYIRRYGRKYGISYLWLLDRFVITVTFAGACIRLGNLMNSEIYGDVTNLPWGFVFARNGELLPKHPTQLYEALSYLILGFVMVWLYKHRLPKLKQGTLFGIFLTFLFGARFVIEFIKEPQSDFEVDMLFNMGQLLSLPFIVAGIAIWIWSVRKGKPAMLPPRKNQRVVR